MDKAKDKERNDIMAKLIYLDNAATTQVYPESIRCNASIFYRILR